MTSYTIFVPLLVLTFALQVGHVLIHVVYTLVLRRQDLPAYDAWVGYAGALTWFILVLITINEGLLPLYVSLIVGLPLSAEGLYIHVAGLRTMASHRGEAPLVTEGVYARLRHPIYYGWVLFSFGLPILLDSEFGLVTAPLWSGLILAVAAIESIDLKRRYPEEYADWSRSVLI